jgi:hypothetical protein
VTPLSVVVKLVAWYDPATEAVVGAVLSLHAAAYASVPSMAYLASRVVSIPRALRC